MTIEFLQDRVSKTKEKIIKKQKTLERHMNRKTKLLKEFKDFGFDCEYKEFRPQTYDKWINDQRHNDAWWKAMDIDTVDENIHNTEKEIKELEEKLTELSTKIRKEQDKDSNRNIPVLNEFLDQWESQCYQFYIEQGNTYQIELKSFKESQYQLYGQIRSLRNEHHREDADHLYNTYQSNQKEFTRKWSHVIYFMQKEGDYKDVVIKELHQDRLRKYDDLVNRVEKICGKITDVSMLRCNPKGNLDGYVTGNDGKASVNTIGAGGYNIQCYHYRTLVKEYQGIEERIAAKKQLINENRKSHPVTQRNEMEKN